MLLEETYGGREGVLQFLDALQGIVKCDDGAAARAVARLIADVKMSRCMMHLSILNCQLSLVLVREFAVEHLVDDEHSVRHADCAVVVYVAANLAYLPTI